MLYLAHKKILISSLPFLALFVGSNAYAIADIIPYSGSNSAYTLTQLTLAEYNQAPADSKFTFYDDTKEYYYSWKIKDDAVSSSRLNSGTGGVNLEANFFNIANSSSIRPYGGAINLSSGSIGNIRGDFINNSISNINTTTYMAGGAIYNQGKIGDIYGDFVGNFIKTQDTAFGGAIDNYFGTMGNVYGNFIGNYAFSTTKSAYGGAMMNEDSQTKGISANFLGNYALSQNPTGLAYGGAVWTNMDLTFFADNTDNIFSGNYTLDSRGKIYNAIFVDKGKIITFDLLNNGNITFYDNIDGSLPYNIKIIGDNTGHLNINNDIINAGNVNVRNSYLKFGKGLYGKGDFKNSRPNMSLNNSTFDLANGYMDNINISNFSSSNNSFLHLDVNPDTMTADKININGNLDGTTKLIVYASSATNIQNMGSILFATATNDTLGNENSFEVFRVFTSPYLYGIEYINHDPNNKQWGLIMNNDANPDFLLPPDPFPDEDFDSIMPPRIKVVSEVIAYNALPAAALEQTRSLKQSLAKNLNNPENLEKHVWITPISYSADIDKPFEIDASIGGADAGVDLQNDMHHRLGVFASYRQGDYDVSGKGKKLYSSVSSKLNIDSYIAGIYYTFQKNNWQTLAALGGGIQDVQIKTDDGIQTRTRGTELNAYFEVGKTFDLNSNFGLEPIASVSHTQLNFNNIHDEYGKTVRYEKIGLTELELALKLSYTQVFDGGETAAYIKPGIVQAISSGDKVKITGMDIAETYDNNTMGRLEIGGNLALDNKTAFSLFATGTTGAHYESLGVGLEITYKW